MMAAAPKILVVDDSTFTRALLRKELGDAFDVREASNGLKALSLIKAGYVPDLVTLDIEMDGIDGFETCRQLYSAEYRQYFPHLPNGRVPVVLLTARDALADRHRGFELGALDFLSKQFEPGTLAKTVAKILNPHAHLRGVQVLLVDDSDMIRFVVGKALREVGVEVIEAVDGFDGFTILCNRMSSIDLVITDIEMPKMTGPEFCRRIRHEIGLVEMPVVFFTGASQEQRLLAFEAGATDCLTKPFIKEEMISRLGVHVEKALLNRHLRQAVAELRSNLQRQRDTLATLSHDMRSPLNGIMGFSELLAMSPGHSASALETIDLIKQSGQMLLGLVEDILTLSKQQSGARKLELELIDLHPVLSRSVAIFQGLARRKNQRVTFEVKTDRATIAGHEESLLRVFNNLISNALKFTPEGGRVTLSLAAGTEGKVTVAVADTGIGIPPDKIGRIFDRYSSASRRGTAGESSTGLGMSIVREFVDAHEGEISVTSQEGMGSRFCLTFPLAGPVSVHTEDEAQGQAMPEEQHARLQRLARGTRVLVADDNPVNRSLVRVVLTNAGCTVREVENGSEAVDLLAATPSGFDLVLMDMQMPEMDGLTATRVIRESGNDVPVVALTGNADDTDRDACLAVGMIDFLTKPFSPKALLTLVARHRRGGDNEGLSAVA